MVEVSIALPTYNRAHSLERCIMSVREQTFKDFELLVIDDGSTDQTLEIVSKLKKSDNRIHYHKNMQNLGLPKSRNIAIGMTKSDLVFFIEDDLILERQCLEILFNTYQELDAKQIQIGAIGPRLIEPNQQKISSNPQVVVKIDKLTGMITANWGIEVQGIIEVPTLHSCSLIHKSVFKTAGLYDYNYYKGSAFREETDFYYRVKRAGFKLFFQSTAITYHYPQSSGGCFLSPFRNRFFEMRNHLLFIGKFYGFKTLFMVPSFLLYSSARAIQFFKGSSVHRNS